MKTLRSISIAVLFFLVIAAPAAADELSLSSTSIYPDESISFTLKVEHNNTSLDVTSESSCKLESNIHALETWSFGLGTHTATYNASALGTYTLCEYYAEGAEHNPPAKIIKTFEVVARPVPSPAPAPPVITSPASPAPVVAPISSPPTTTLPPLAPVSKPLTKAQKLHAALAKCKHQKNKRKRAKCERGAKKAARR